ncbi:hypothetical protein U1Q18_030388 [Sarracenia purpurea var. burkii]
MASEKTRSLCLPTKSRSVATCDGSGFVAAASMAVEAGTLEKGEGGGALGVMRRMANQRSRYHCVYLRNPYRWRLAMALVSSRRRR